MATTATTAITATAATLKAHAPLLRRRILSGAAALLLSAGCAGAKPAASTSASNHNAPTEAPAPGHGGRLFDKWYKAVDAQFKPDDASTEALDGSGGPFGNGTLPDADGKPMANPGHDYRLKNMLGWDLRGAEGIYGPAHKDRKGVLVPNLMADTDTRAHWLERLRDGDDAIPAYGSVLSAQDLDALVDFMLGVRDGNLPRPEDSWSLAEGSAGHYRLNDGGDPQNGRTLYGERCAGCHGDDGTDILFDGGEYSLGMLTRAKAYEVSMKIVSGHPGSPMAAQLRGEHDAQVSQLKDLLAALCDRDAYPRGAASKTDVPDADPRCGALLR